MRLLPILFLILTSTSLFAQKTTSDVFSTTRITWFGLDFTKLKLIDGAGIPIVEDVKNRFVPSWNRLFIEEADKYDLAKYYKKSLVAKDLKSVRELNKTINTEELVTYDAYSFGKEEVTGMVKKYDSKASDGIGLVFIVESLDKVNEKATVHLTFFDIETRNVLFHKRMEASPGGFGIRNYWAKSFLKIMEQSKKEWKKWAKSI